MKTEQSEADSFDELLEKFIVGAPEKKKDLDLEEEVFGEEKNEKKKAKNTEDFEQKNDKGTSQNDDMDDKTGKVDRNERRDVISNRDGDIEDDEKDGDEIAKNNNKEINSEAIRKKDEKGEFKKESKKTLKRNKGERKQQREEKRNANKKRNRKITLGLALVLLLGMMSGAIYYLLQYDELQEKEARVEEFSEEVSFYSKTVNDCFSFLIVEDGLNLNLDSRLIENCVEGLEQVDGRFDVSAIKNSVADAEEYLGVIKRVDGFFDENSIVLASADFGPIDEIAENAAVLKDGYREHAEEKLNTIKSERDKMNYAKEKVGSLFSGERVADWANLGAYNEIKGLVDSLSQEDLKAELYKKLEIVYPVVEERYRIEQERIRREREEAERRAREYQARVAAAWHAINIPYISQNNNGVNNGCEAASLLMALKAKGYASNIGYIDFVNNMPKSDDPNTGFYLDIYKSEPRDEAHWIAPAPLAAYGASVGGGAVNITGTGVDGLDAEVANGNPVVVYVTYNFAGAGRYSKGVPNNLHVVVLAGYNEVTGEQVIVDPWTSGGRTKYNVSKAAFQNAYRASGYRAVVVR